MKAAGFTARLAFKRPRLCETWDRSPRPFSNAIRSKFRLQFIETFKKAFVTISLINLYAIGPGPDAGLGISTGAGVS